MANYNWAFASVGGNSRVRISTGEDIRHLGELDLKMWTVLSCPSVGLEIDSQTLDLLDVNHDGRVRANEVIEASQWLCSKLANPDILLESKSELALVDIVDVDIQAIAREIAGEKEVITLAEVEAAIANVGIDAQPLPVAPYGDQTADIIAAYNSTKDVYSEYFRAVKIQELGLMKLPEETVAPNISEQDWLNYGTKIAEYQAGTVAVEAANASALAAATAKYQPLRKLLLLTRDFYTLLRNYITFEDLYDSGKKAIFQAGTLVIDQRMCELCLRVEDMDKHNMQASASGMYLLYCDCTNKLLGQQMKIVASVTQGDVHNLMVGKNAIFFDRAGREWDAVVVKIIDNPISIKQAFFTPYRKLGNWIREFVDKTAAEKEGKSFDMMQIRAAQAANRMREDTAAPAAEKKSAFDIAKFAGIFASVGLAIGFITTAATGIAKGIIDAHWYQLILGVVGLLFVISGPSMFIAWLKLRRRNIGPLLNANGWAINAEAIVSVPFGATLTSQAQFPFLGKRMPKWQKWLIGVAAAVVLLLIVWLSNGLKWAHLPSPFNNKTAVVQVEPQPEPAAETAEAAPAAETAE